MLEEFVFSGAPSPSSASSAVLSRAFFNPILRWWIHVPFTPSACRQKTWDIVFDGIERTVAISRPTDTRAWKAEIQIFLQTLNENQNF